MGYEALGEVQVVSLGGVNKATGKKNPTELEGYYLGSEDRPNKFNSNKPQKFYMFQTEQGDVGIYGKTGLDRVMRGARIGAMTKVVATGELLDTGKGNPMKVFKAFQDKTNFIDVVNSPSETSSYSSTESEEDQDSDQQDVPEQLSKTTPSSVREGSETRQAKMQAILNKHKVNAM